jgi:hypothetical protein
VSVSQRNWGRQTPAQPRIYAIERATHDWRKGLPKRIGMFLLRVPTDRWLMALVTALTMVLYLWNAPHALDLPEYDEATYFSRGYHLLLGDFQLADIGNPNSSPLSVIYYALWYALLRTPRLYPLVMSSSLFLLGIGAYLLLSRVLHPLLSWVLAIIAVAGSAPFAPWNANYYLGAGVLWLSLALLDHGVWRRALAPVGVLVAALARPEFIIVALTLLVALAAYELRMWRQGRMQPRTLALAYTPLATGLLIFAVLSASVPKGDDYRSAVALPWSYNDFYNVRYHAQFKGPDSYADPWIIYEQDFGPVQPRTTANTILSLRHNPGKMTEYIVFDSERLWAAFGTSALHSLNWQSDEWERKLQVDITPETTIQFALYLFAFFALAGTAGLWLWRVHLLSHLPIQRTAPALIGIGSLTALLIPLLLINPHQRFFMLLPLALLFVGIGLTLMLAVPVFLLERAPAVRLALPRPILRAVLAMLTLALTLVATPQAYLSTPVHPIEQTVDFLKAHVPAGSTIVGEPVISYANYLEAEGMTLHPLSPTNAGLVGAFEADPSLTYALLTRVYPQQTYDQWFADWNKTFPQLPWHLLAKRDTPELKLYVLPPHGGGYGRVSYALWLGESERLSAVASDLPEFDAVDFDQALFWNSQTPGHAVIPLMRTIGTVPAKSWVMHPYYPGVDAYPDVTWQDEASLPPAWAGRQLILFAALAPWAASQPGAEGVKLTFSINSYGFSQTVEVLNTARPRWTPIVIRLPAYSGAATLTLSIAPRVSIANDTTLVSFVGVTATAS